MPVRNISPAPAQKFTLAGLTEIDRQNKTVIAMSNDRTRFYATDATTSYQNRLHMSTDGGASWTLLRTEGSTTSIVGFLELPNGEVLLGTNGLTSGNSRVWKSSGFAANPLTATWTQKFQMLGSKFENQYSFNKGTLGANGVVLISEAGGQTGGPDGVVYTARGTGYTTATLAATASGGTGQDIRAYCQGGQIFRVGILNGGSGHTPASGTATYDFDVTGDGTGGIIKYRVTNGVIDGSQFFAARRVYMSTDFGETFTMIFDVYTTPAFKYGAGLHMHFAVYDELWDRIWIGTGDNSGDGTRIVGNDAATATQVWYSDDRGVTWQIMATDRPLLVDMGQYTSMRCYQDYLCFGGDVMGFGTVQRKRTGYRTFGPLMQGIMHRDGAAIYYDFFRAGSNLPIFISYGSATAGINQPIMASADEGRSWYEFWRETDLVNRPQLAGWKQDAFGPDTSNRMIINYGAYGKLLVGTLQTNFTTPVTPANTRARIAYGNATAGAASAAALLAASQQVTGATTDRNGSFTSAPGTGQYTYIIVTAAAFASGLVVTHTSQTTGAFSGAGQSGPYEGLDSNPTTEALNYTEGGTAWKILRSSLPNTAGTFTLS